MSDGGGSGRKLCYGAINVCQCACAAEGKAGTEYRRPCRPELTCCSLSDVICVWRSWSCFCRLEFWNHTRDNTVKTFRKQPPSKLNLPILYPSEKNGPFDFMVSCPDTRTLDSTNTLNTPFLRDPDQTGSTFDALRTTGNCRFGQILNKRSKSPRHLTVVLGTLIVPSNRQWLGFLPLAIQQFSSFSLGAGGLKKTFSASANSTFLFIDPATHPTQTCRHIGQPPTSDCTVPVLFEYLVGMFTHCHVLVVLLKFRSGQINRSWETRIDRSIKFRAS